MSGLGGTGRSRTMGHRGACRDGRWTLALALAAAIPLSPFPPAGAQTGDSSLQLAVVAAEGYSGFAEPLRQVVRDTVEWRRVWGRIYAGVDPAPPLPSIDFAHEIVLVVALGERRSGGYGIAVDEVRLAGDRLRVQVRLDCPSPGVMTTMALTQPVQAVRLVVPALAQGRAPEFVDSPAPDCAP